MSSHQCFETHSPVALHLMCGWGGGTFCQHEKIAYSQNYIYYQYGICVINHEVMDFDAVHVYAALIIQFSPSPDSTVGHCQGVMPVQVMIDQVCVMESKLHVKWLALVQLNKFDCIGTSAAGCFYTKAS